MKFIKLFLFLLVSFIGCAAFAKTQYLWTCRAESPKGAWGLARNYSTEAEARREALSVCHYYAKNETCQIQYCNYETYESQPTKNCSECTRFLINSVRSRLGSANNFLLPNWVDESIANFYACEKDTPQKSCADGRIKIRTIKGCDNFRANPNAYEQCINRAAH